MKNFKTILILILILSAVIFFLLTCKKKKVVIPDTPTIADQVKPVIINEGLSKKSEDSLIYLADKYKKSAISWEKAYYKLSDDYTDLANNSDVIINQPVNDSCKEYQAQIKALSVKVKQLSKEKDEACRMALSNYAATITKKDNLIANGKKDYVFVRAAFDTCLKNQATLKKALKQLEPKRSIGAGVISDVYPKFDAGATLYYRDKKGNQFNINAMASQRFSVVYSKNIFKF